MPNNVLLKSGIAYDYGNPNKSQVIDTARGGTYGYAADFANIANNQPWLRHQGIVFVLNVPNIFKPEFHIVDNADEWAKAIISLMETKAEVVEGHNHKLTGDIDEVKLTRDGSKFFEVSKGTNNERVTPTFTFPSDVIGRPLAKILDYWIRIGINDPDTGYALMHSIVQEQNNPTRFSLFDMYAMDYIIVQPDHTGFNCERAILVRNSFPKSGVDEKITKSGEHIGIEQIDLELTALAISNNQTRLIGQSLLNKAMSGGLADPQNIPVSNDGGESLNPDANLPNLDPASGENGSYNNTVKNTRPTVETGP